jgi:serine/threonine protein kinase
MFGDADFGIGGLDFDGSTKIFVRRNGGSGALKEIRLSPGSRISDLLEKAGKALDLDAPQRAFHSNGMECDDVNNLDEDEVLSVSCGEPFKAEGSGHNGSGGGPKLVGNFILQECIGQGGFGSVLKGVHIETGELAAVKFVPKSSFRQISDLQRVYQEIQSLRNLRHPNVIRILDVAEHPDSICFIMEFAANGELKDYVEKRGSLTEEESRHFFKQIVRAVHFIHSKNIIHRDLKLENILLDAQNKCKIVDFGLSDHVSGKEKTVTDAGTEAYLAPEVFNGSSGASDPYKIDSWSLGVILYALAHGKLPFQRPDLDTCAKLEVEGGPHCRDEMSAGFKRLVRIMMIPKPAKRAAVSDVVLDPWMTMNRFASMDGMHGDQRKRCSGF